ncbi:unnamed protein product [Zymoseptoria tritici ST99CH_3D1]|uniref:Cyclin N-terminal domain-containing protein n=3 Tax=Zymoseptoria tritici TaxID=1047171 RepID=A0A1X7RRU1_ZYMT9|nr:unnamed protein product [Zymoseptoria tritici ST99CH_3D7]SMR51109.1 unnamed protein product [Zymoseptoria tritici ST99CH_1E4]SMR52046.1 unnamed protein product [Zymoseptoria tritici ST99CH_3D1]
MNLTPTRDVSPDGYRSYEPSSASSAPSSQASVFSDTLSAHSSIASSVSDDFRSIHEDPQERDRILAQTQLRFGGQLDAVQEYPASRKLPNPNTTCPTYADITSVPAPQRQNPRRCSLSKGQKPPPLVRQRDRKINFVDNLVDSATQMVEVIWPLSSVLCKSESGERAVLPLRTYIEETLRRSRTSYSTLQVALYYLILIRPYVPKADFTMELFADCPADRALMCGRRMFLAALILASKYLQDRNYSAKAWSKMSGLKVCEINAHERCFLSKVGWKLHLPKPLFEKWQDIVLRYTPNPSSPSAGVGTSTWQRMVPLLTPELDNMPSIESALMGCPIQLPSRESLSSTPTPTIGSFNNARLESSESPEHTPTPRTALPPPRFLEPKPDLAPRMGLLPTPNLTPASTASNTPAASGYERSMCSVMRMEMANFETRHPLCPRAPALIRRPSIVSASSYNSSPESMMSDHSRSSRSSSISSISTVSTTSSMAPNRACLARQATCRNAGLPPLRLVKEETEGTVSCPIVIDDTEMGESPEMIDFSQSEKVLHAPHRHSRAARHPPQTSLPAVVKSNGIGNSRKRGRPSGHRRSELQEEVRYLLEESLDEDMDVDDDDLLSEESPAVTYTTAMLARIPMQKNDGKKRTCCSARPMSVSPAPLYGEVV